MARPRTIDREQVLDAAEKVVSADGVAALSFGSVAAEAGISKASVQSVFGNREAMIEAMLERWTSNEQSRFEAEVGDERSSAKRIATHIRLTATEIDEVNSRTAAPLAALSRSGDQSRSVTEWYKSRVGQLKVGKDLSREERVAFLAAEGALFLRHFIGFDFSEEVWGEIYADLENFAAEGKL